MNNKQEDSRVRYIDGSAIVSMYVGGITAM